MPLHPFFTVALIWLALAAPGLYYENTHPQHSTTTNLVVLFVYFILPISAFLATRLKIYKDAEAKYRLTHPAPTPQPLTKTAWLRLYFATWVVALISLTWAFIAYVFYSEDALAVLLAIGFFVMLASIIHLHKREIADEPQSIELPPVRPVSETAILSEAAQRLSEDLDKHLDQ